MKTWKKFRLPIMFTANVVLGSSIYYKIKNTKIEREHPVFINNSI